MIVAEEKQLADCQQAEIEQLQRKVSELQGELKSEMKHSRAVDSDAHVCIFLSLYCGVFCRLCQLCQCFMSLSIP